MNARALSIAALALAVLVSAISVVYVKHRSRVLFVELRSLERTRDQLDVQWSQLAIERSSVGTLDRIEQVARERLGFNEPSVSDIEVVVVE